MSFDLRTQGYQCDAESRIWSRPGFAGLAYNDGDDVENRIATAIASATDVSVFSAELAAHCTDWPSLYHLSRRRSNLLRPLQSRLRGKKVLEIGAGCGAISRWLGEAGADLLALEGSVRRARIAASRCRDLPGVTVLAESLHEFRPGPSFDVVTLIGVLEYARKYFPATGCDPIGETLQHVKGLLRPGGILILAIENQLGLKYFAGYPEDHTGLPMFGIEDRYRIDDVVTFGQLELRKRLADAGFPAQDWWYPFPDYKLPTVNIAEGFLAQSNEFDLAALIGPALVGDPQAPDIPSMCLPLAARPVHRNGLLGPLSNSFLVVASEREQETADVSAWHYAVDRKRPFAKQTEFSRTDDGSFRVLHQLIFPSGSEEAPDGIRHELPDSEYLHGVHWNARLAAILQERDWSAADIADWARFWLDAVFAEAELAGVLAVESGKRAAVPGRLLDATPWNLIACSDGVARFFDQEWKTEEDLPIGYLAFRGIYLSFLGLGSVAAPAPGTPLNCVQLFLDVAGRLGLALARSDVDDFCSRERAFQRAVSDTPGLDPEDVRSFSLKVRSSHQELCALTARLREVEARLSADVTRLRGESEALARGKAALESERVSLVAQRDLAQETVATITSSRSWRLTKPLRVAARTIRFRGLAPEDRAAATQIARRVHASLPLPAGIKRRMRSVWVSLFGSPAPLPVPARELWSTGTAEVPAPTISPACSGMQDYVVWGVIDWHFRMQRPQHIARELAAAGHRVFYVSNALVDASSPGFRIESLDENGKLFQLNLHAAGAPVIYGETPSRDIVSQLRAGLAEFRLWSDSKSLVSLVQHPFWYPIARAQPNGMVVYDCMDHHDGFGNTAAGILTLERELMREADLVVVTSEWLDQVASEHNSSRALIRNAGEYARFSVPPQSAYRDPQGRKVIGYYGAIADWFDAELVGAIAERYRDCLLLLVGADTSGAAKQLGRHANVKFTGEVPYAELTHYLYGFDVCLLPFKVIPLTLATNPVKVYEYLAGGRSVVSVDLPEMRQFGDLVAVAENKEAFVRKVGEALENPASPAEVERRRAFAASQTWADRASALASAVSALPEPKVSIVVVTYNNLELTKTCLKSLEELSDYPDFETIVVDNASADQTPAFLREWVDGGANRRLILNEDNRGFAAANNQGLAAATGDYLVLLNNDTHVTPGWIRTLVQHLRRDQTIGLVGPVTNNIGNEAKIRISYNDMREMLVESSRYTHRHAGQTFDIRTAAFFCVMMPRSTYEAVGPLDEAFGIGFFEDDDYCRRVEAVGKRVVCAEDVFIHHHLSASFNKLADDRRRKLFETNKAIYEAKWGAWVPHRYR